MTNLLHNIPNYLFELFIFNILTVNVGMILIFIYNLPIAFYGKSNTKIKNIFNEMLNEIILFKKDINDDDIKKIKRLRVKRNRRVRIIFINLLKDYTIFLKGNEFEILTKIYKSLDLHKQDIKDLDSRFEKRVISAIDRLNRFKINVDREKMIKLQKHKKPDIRELANCYTLNMYHHNIYDFFNFTPEPLTKWQQLEYFQLIINRYSSQKTDFSPWISSKYDLSVVNLALDLVAHYYQANAVPYIHEMIKIDDSKLRRKMIKTLGIINHQDSIEVLINLFHEEKNINCKLEIVKSLGYMGNNNKQVTDFLENLLKIEFHTNLRKAILIATTRANSSVSVVEKRIYNFELEKQIPNEHKIS